MGGTRSTHKECIRNFSQRTWRVKTIWEKKTQMEGQYKDESSRNKAWACWLDLTGSEQGPVVSLCEQGNEPSGS
jgi:hypothetical protein